jgi:hypothetical protein
VEKAPLRDTVEPTADGGYCRAVPLSRRSARVANRGSLLLVKRPTFTA